jgi:hypothetical protein
MNQGTIILLSWLIKQTLLDMNTFFTFYPHKYISNNAAALRRRHSCQNYFGAVLKSHCGGSNQELLLV